MLAQLEDDVTEEDDDNEIIFFELDAINIALAIGAAALLSQVLKSDSDSDDDSLFPVITINGDNPVTVELGDTYTDAGASAIDVDGNPLTVSSTSNVNTSSTGTYTVTYSATDSEGRVSIETRTVIVVDTITPVITITGDNPVTVELGDTYTDAGATATDASGSATVTSSGTVDYYSWYLYHYIYSN